MTDAQEWRWDFDGFWRELPNGDTEWLDVDKLNGFMARFADTEQRLADEYHRLCTWCQHEKQAHRSTQAERDFWDGQELATPARCQVASCDCLGFTTEPRDWTTTLQELRAKLADAERDANESAIYADEVGATAKQYMDRYIAAQERERMLREVDGELLAAIRSHPKFEAIYSASSALQLAMIHATAALDATHGNSEVQA